MVIEVDNTKQLSIFDTVVGILLKNSVIAKKFNKSKFFLFAPRIKASSFQGFPYIVVQVPLISDTELLVFDHATTLKPFLIPIKLVLEFEAKDNLIKFANAILSSIEASESTFEALGYINLKINLVDTDNELDSQKETAVAFFDLMLDGRVLR